jgi:hypothetical protein
LTKRGSTAPSKYDPNAPRVSKREQLRNQRRRRSLIWNVIVLGTAGLFLAAIAFYTVASQRPGPLPGEVQIPVEGAAVVPAGASIIYDNYPPSSGTHYADPAPWGFSETPVPEGQFVSNLARGGVVYLYHCPEACPELEQQMRTLARRVPRESRYNTVKAVVSPYERPLDAPIVALAWGRQMNLAEYDEARLLRWYQRFVNQGPNVGP